MESLVHDYGLFLLFLLIAMESAGIPLPGETALVAAGVLASRGDMNIVAVIAVAATAAVIGDNVGYWAGRVGGRKLLQTSRSEDDLPGSLLRHPAGDCGLSRRGQQDALVALLPLERRGWNRLGGARRPRRLLRRPGGRRCNRALRAD